jgi:hypothetical protein
VLCIANKDVHLGFEPGWIIQTCSGQADDTAFRVFRAGQPRAASGAEAAQVVSTGQAWRGVMLQRAFGQLERPDRHDDHGCVAAAAHLLAIAAVAFEHQQRSGTAFVADFTANATAGKRKVHGIELPQYWENFHCDLKPRDAKQRDGPCGLPPLAVGHQQKRLCNRPREPELCDGYLIWTKCLPESKLTRFHRTPPCSQEQV